MIWYFDSDHLRQQQWCCKCTLLCTHLVGDFWLHLPQHMSGIIDYVSSHVRDLRTHYTVHADTPGHLCLLSQCLLLLTNAAWYDICLLDTTCIGEQQISVTISSKEVIEEDAWWIVQTHLVTCLCFVPIPVLTNATSCMAFWWLTGLTHLCTIVHFELTRVHISGLNSYTRQVVSFSV